MAYLSQMTDPDFLEMLDAERVPTTFERVAEFHKKFGIPHVDKTPKQILEGRLELIWEEFKEVLEAAGYMITDDYDGNYYVKKRPYYKLNKEHLLKELADLDYVVAGTAEVFKWDFDEACRRVHESNMGKIWPDGTIHYREDGKVLKPDSYQPPNLKDLV